MTNTKNILIICRTLEETKLLSRVKINQGNNYVIASEDIRVHKKLKRCKWVETVCFIEKTESCYSVAEDVVNFLEIINKWLESLGDNQRGIPKELLFWVRHVEGGMTTQRIQDMLLLIRSYFYLIENYKISKIIILSNSSTYWEDSILCQTARVRNIDIQIIGHFCIAAFRVYQCRH